MGALDATVHTSKASQYNVQGYPTIKYFSGGKKDRSSAEDYTGGRTARDIIQWALDKAAESLPAPEVVEVNYYLLKITIFLKINTLFISLDY